MDRAGLITLEQARAAGLSFDEPEPRACPHCGAALEPLGAALAGRVAWVSAAPCPCEGAVSEREAEARRRANLAAKEEEARREKVLARAGIPRRYWAAVARYAKCDVLVLDDLGKEDATEWSVGTVFSVLDARYEDMRPTIVTSNYAPGALADRLARRGERVTAEAIASRISQTCRPVYLGGRDRRRRG